MLSMAMGAERSSSTTTAKPPLHNFDFSCLKWGSQRQLRCIKLSDSSDRHRTVRSLPSTAAAGVGDSEFRRLKKHKQDEGFIEGIREVREKVIWDLKTEASKMKEEILRKEGLMIREEANNHEQSLIPSWSPSTSRGTGVVGVDTGLEIVKPWNLRTRKPVKPLTDKVTASGIPVTTGKLSSNNNNNNNNNNNQSPMRMLRGEKEREKVRVKFSLPLSRKEIEEDFMAMVNHRPARRPKKRPRAVQKQLDYVYPGVFLTEVTPDIYD